MQMYYILKKKKSCKYTNKNQKYSVNCDYTQGMLNAGC